MIKTILLRKIIYLHSSEMLRRIDWYSVTDFSGQPIVSTFKGQAVRFFLDCCFLEDGTDKLSRNIGN
jgi:hypothetical protein